MSAIASFAALVFGILIGTVLTWITCSARENAKVQAAIAESAATSRVQIAQLEERIRFASQELQVTRDARDYSQTQESNLREQLEQTRNEQARLTERSLRVPSLEADLADVEEQLRKINEALRISSASEAQKQQLVTSLTSQNGELEAQAAEVKTRLATVSASLLESNERRAALEEQAARIPELQRKLDDNEGRLRATDLQLTELRESSGRQNGALVAELDATRETLHQVRLDLTSVQDERAKTAAEASRLTDELTELRTRSDADRQNSEEKLQLLLRAKEALTDQFKSLANEILEEKSKRFAEQNQTSLGQLLEPLKTKLSEFQGKVEEVYVQEGKDRTKLAAQVDQLVALNQMLSQDAKNLTQALKGSAKTQGNWGELILERVLEASGLRKGEEYFVQDTQHREDGTRAQPDVVINLPESRKLVVDSKVSLIAYDRFVSAESDEERTLALRQHVDSVRNHIRALSDKQYQALYGKSLDFVLAFVPIEPAFMTAVTNDSDLFMDAWQRNVLLVSPSTLLFVVRTVAHLWRQEAQSRNAQEIARRGAEMYDKLCSFVEDLQAVGTRITQAQKSYDAAHAKLATGRMNVIRQAERLRELGVRPAKALPDQLLETSLADEEAILLPGGVVPSTSVVSDNGAESTVASGPDSRS